LASKRKANKKKKMETQKKEYTSAKSSTTAVTNKVASATKTKPVTSTKETTKKQKTTSQHNKVVKPTAIRDQKTTKQPVKAKTTSTPKKSPAISHREHNNSFEKPTPEKIEIVTPSTKKEVKKASRFKKIARGFGKFIWTFTYIFFFIVFIGSIAAAYIAYPIFLDYQDSLPPLSINKITNRMKANSTVYDKYDAPVSSLAEAAFVSVSFDEIPQSFIDAITATEDARFFTHNGIDGPRTAQALVVNALNDDISSGGSTITQQLIKMTSLQDKILDSQTGKEYKASTERKVHEMILAYQLETQMSKEDIFTAYANSLGYSRFVGVGTAAKRFFNKNVSQLTLPEAALLAGIPQSSSANYPYYHMEKATERYGVVVNSMVKQGFITNEEADAIAYIPLSNLLLSTSSSSMNKNMVYLDSIEAELNQIFNVTVNPEAGESFPYYYTGLKIYSALDVEQQNHATWMMNTEDVVPYSQMLDNLRNAWDENENLQAAFAVVDVKTGEIPAIGAARNYDGYNMALHGYRSPGSSIKPLIDYAPGMEKFGWDPYKTFKDEKTYYSGTRNEVYNFSTSVSNKDVSINQAVAESLNTVAVKVMQQVGVDYAGKFVDSIGIERAGTLLKDGNLYESAALGGGLEVTPVQMAGAYASFGNAGRYNQPHFIRRIENEYGEVIYEYKQDPVQMMSPSTARDITTTLKYTRWSGTPAGGGRRSVSRAINFAAKTGTSSYGTDERRAYGLSSSAEKDHWIVGYSPEYAIAVWTGFNNESPDFLTKTGGNVNANKAYGSYLMESWMDRFAPAYTDFNFDIERNDFISIASLAVNIDNEDFTVSWNRPKISYPIALDDEQRHSYGSLVFDVYIINDGEETKIIDGDGEITKLNYSQYLTGEENSIKIVARLSNNNDIVHTSERKLKLR